MRIGTKSDLKHIRMDQDVLVAEKKDSLWGKVGPDPAPPAWTALDKVEPNVQKFVSGCLKF